MMFQDKALAILKSGKNVFLTGSAGAGKTYVLNKYIEYLKYCEVPVAITASTGIAATHMNGMTIHAWSGIGVKDSLLPKDLVAMKEKKYLKDKLTEAQVLIIDEISMLHKQQIEMVNLVLKSFKENNLPFGGIQVVFSGDFFQLPPVGRQGEEPRDKFAFMSNAWKEAEPVVCYLSEQHRQSDNSLNKLLNAMRDGFVDGSLLKHLEETMQRKSKDEHLLTRLYTHNLDVDRLNSEYLKRLKVEPKLFKAEIKGNETLRSILSKSVLTDEELELRIGARVMFIKNNYEKGYMNGSTGDVMRFNEDGLPIVKLKNGKDILVEQEEWSIQDDHGKSLASFKQIPLRLAWAITIHKSQGMTLDEAIVDLGKTFERGQGYVALSRLRDMESLYLEGFNSLALELDALALKADRRFRELSQIADTNWSIEELEKRFDTWVEICGGTPFSKVDKSSSKSSGKKTKKIKPFKESTYKLTADLIRKGKSLKAIAKERSLSESTIVTHIIKLKETGEDLDFEPYKPTKSHMKMVTDAVEELNQKENSSGIPTSLTPVYKQLNEKLTYQEIKLALVFLKEDL